MSRLLDLVLSDTESGPDVPELISVGQVHQVGEDSTKVVLWRMEDIVVVDPDKVTL